MKINRLVAPSDNKKSDEPSLVLKKKESQSKDKQDLLPHTVEHKELIIWITSAMLFIGSTIFIMKKSRKVS